MKHLSALIAMLFASVSISVFAQATPAKPAEPAKPATTAAPAKPATPATPATPAPSAKAEAPKMTAEEKKAEKKAKK